MRKFLFTLLSMLLHSIVLANGVVEIKMSEAHEVGHVVVKPSNEYHVNMESYEIPVDAKLIIFHVLDSPQSHYYYQEIKPGKSVYKMTARELKATINSPPFDGLKNHDSAFLIVGSETQQGSINMGVLYSNDSISVIVRE